MTKAGRPACLNNLRLRPLRQILPSYKYQPPQNPVKGNPLRAATASSNRADYGLVDRKSYVDDIAVETSNFLNSLGIFCGQPGRIPQREPPGDVITSASPGQSRLIRTVKFFDNRTGVEQYGTASRFWNRRQKA